MRIDLGKIAFTDAGTYSSSRTYEYFDFVLSDGSTYLSLKNNNVGHELTEGTWWKILAKAGSPGSGGSGEIIDPEPTPDPTPDPQPDPQPEVIEVPQDNLDYESGGIILSDRIGYDNGAIIDLDDTPEHNGPNNNYTTIAGYYRNDGIIVGS